MPLVYLKLVEYIRNFKLADLSKFEVSYDPVSKAYELTRWDYTELKDGITRPNLATLIADRHTDYTLIQDEIEMSKYLMEKSYPRAAVVDTNGRLYSVYWLSSRIAVTDERQIPVSVRFGSRLISGTYILGMTESRGNIVLKFSGFYKITISRVFVWPPDYQPGTGAVKLVWQK